MARCAILQLGTEGVNQYDYDCQCQNSREEDVRQIIAVVRVLVSYLVDIHIDRLYPSHYRILIDTLRPQYLALDCAVGEIDHCQYVLVGQCASDEVQSVHVIRECRTTAGLDIGIHACRNDADRSDLAALHVLTRLGERIIFQDLAQLRRVQLAGKVSG